MLTKEQIIQKLESLSERNLTRLLQFANGLSQNGDNVEKTKEGTEND
jgi:hypothetical protein